MLTDRLLPYFRIFTTLLATLHLRPCFELGNSGTTQNRPAWCLWVWGRGRDRHRRLTWYRGGDNFGRLVIGLHYEMQSVTVFLHPARTRVTRWPPGTAGTEVQIRHDRLVPVMVGPAIEKIVMDREPVCFGARASGAEDLPRFSLAHRDS